MPSEDSNANLTSEERVKLLLRGAIFHLRIALKDRLERSEKITGALRDDRQAWELESVVLEIAKYTLLVKIVESLIEFIG